MSLVTLVSGGLDSTLMASLILDEDILQYPLFVDYGQLARHREWNTCKKLFLKLGLPRPKKMNLRGFGSVVQSGLTDKAWRLNEDAFLPGRNLLFLLVGAAYAFRKNADGVAIGLLTEEFHIFPDQALKFISECKKLVRITMDRSIDVVTPLMHLTKKDVESLARRHHIVGTYSCHSGHARPCGKCISCMERI